MFKKALVIGSALLILVLGVAAQEETEESPVVCERSFVGREVVTEGRIPMYANYPLLRDLPGRDVPDGAILTVQAWALRNDGMCFMYVDVRLDEDEPVFPDGWVWAQDLFGQPEEVELTETPEG